MKKRQPRNVAFIGRSGSGKGTQAELLENFLTPALRIETGALFRALAKEETPIGHLVRNILEEGGLPPGWLASFLWEREIFLRLTPEKHLIMDGAPRRLEEAELLDRILPDFGRHGASGIYVAVGRAEAKQRLLDRGRGDDDEGTIENRLAYFEKDVVPVLEYYKDKKRLIEINGEQSVEAVHKDIVRALGL
ncbi:MAG: nucleoside monophosphate kinase [Parcubacteria group bacterium]|nr:nucleoside monophosphate kinase [Parcubacteria group bacterium]MBI2175568.1 nucleoside monophosphate kinase [Parcubacteria group bacterium]